MAVLTDVLVVNAGSTSLKLSIVDGDDRSRTRCDRSRESRRRRARSAIESFTAACGSSTPTLIDDDVMAELA